MLNSIVASATFLNAQTGMCVTSDLEDDEVGLLHFSVLGRNVVAEAILPEGVHGLVPVLEQLRLFQLPCRRQRG